MSRWRWPLYAIGATMIAFGVWGQLFGADTNPGRYLELLVFAALGHDLLLAPVVVVLGICARRGLHRQLRGPVQGAAIVAFALFVMAIPGIGRFGARSDNSSILPLNYTHGLLIALAVVATVTLVTVAVRLVRRRQLVRRRR